jgi:hypothetical protein
MTPNDYFYGPFRDHFHLFWHSLDVGGSVSRVRQRFSYSRFESQSSLHFSVIDLVADPTDGFVDHLSDIPEPDRLDFLCALFYLILIDQAMYTHRSVDYDEFQARTLYPKMDRTVGLARMLLMANPYELFQDEILNSRDIERGMLTMRFAKWAPFIVKDLKAFFTKHPIGSTTWTMIRDAMLKDRDCTLLGAEGAMLKHALEADDAIENVRSSPK